MDQNISYKYVIIGFGPSGLSVLDQLLSSGVRPQEIAIIGMQESKHKIEEYVNPFHKSSQSAISRGKELKTYGIAKKGVDTRTLEGPTESLASYWGASHLPPIFLGREYSAFFPRRNIKNAVEANAKMFQIHEVKQGKFIEEFPTCNEVASDNSRKRIAREWVENLETGFIHSRLSIGGHRYSNVGCASSGKCFQVCPSGAFWSPIKELNILIQKNPNVNVIYGQVTEIDTVKKSISIITSPSVSFENLFLCAGSKNSIKILRASKVVAEEINFRYTPVLMFPFLVSKVDENDYNSTHVLADLLLPTIEEQKLKSLTQIYLPTENLAANIFSKLPKVLLKFLDLLPSQAINLIACRIGIAMCFFEDVPSGDSRKSVLRSLRSPSGDLKKNLNFVEARLIQKIKVVALDGLSHHTGSVYLKSDPMNRGLNSEIFVKLREQGVYLADGLALTRIPPGPHTNTICVLARCLVMEVVNS